MARPMASRGSNVLSWLDGAGTPPAVLKYEELIADPCGAVGRALAALRLDFVAKPDARVPSFDALRAIDPVFFRRGVAGAHRDEMSEELHALFWARPENAAAMRLLGYADEGTGS